ncbi:hypothetical protein [[Eubacterium] cellulosolvens]
MQALFLMLGIIPILLSSNHSVVVAEGSYDLKLARCTPCPLRSDLEFAAPFDKHPFGIYQNTSETTTETLGKAGMSINCRLNGN